MINFIIDAANEKIIFVIIDNNRSYTTSYTNSRENFDNFMMLLDNFLKKKKNQYKGYSDNIYQFRTRQIYKFKNFFINSKSYIIGY